MRLPITLAALLGLLAAAVLPAPAADVPEPSPYPIAWEFGFEYKKPARIVVNVPGPTGMAPKAYWYLPYTITNEGEETQVFVPDFQILLENGKLVRARKDVPRQVFEAIKGRERNKFMVPQTRAGGELRPGVDQARDSVAIWEEPVKDMGTFRIFVGGLSGEFVELKDKDSGEVLKNAKGEPIILRKTLQLTYSTNGDEVYPGEDVLAEGENRIARNAKMWVMR
jgi:hypothetical protein